jgi:hypothetical protein
MHVGQGMGSHAPPHRHGADGDLHQANSHQIILREIHPQDQRLTLAKFEIHGNFFSQRKPVA